MPLGILEPFECNLLRNIGPRHWMSKANSARTAGVSVVKPDTPRPLASNRHVIHMKSICYRALIPVRKVVSRANGATLNGAVEDVPKCHDERPVHLRSIQWHQPEALRCRHQTRCGPERDPREERWQGKVAHCAKMKSNESSHYWHARRCPSWISPRGPGAAAVQSQQLIASSRSEIMPVAEPHGPFSRNSKRFLNEDCRKRTAVMRCWSSLQGGPAPFAAYLECRIRYIM
jgi:hypothetical protein